MRHSATEARMAEPERELPRDMQIFRAPPDGQCLFHALAKAEPRTGDAASLRAALTEYLIAQAPTEGSNGHLWLEEGNLLRDDPTMYGGHTTVVAFSKMMGRQIIIHDTVLRARCQATHPSAAGEADAIHLLYNGRNHYDLLLRDRDSPLPPPKNHKVLDRAVHSLFQIFVMWLPSCTPLHVPEGCR